MLHNMPTTEAEFEAARQANVENWRIIRKAVAPQPWYISHAETITQNVVGQLLAFIVFRAFGIGGGFAWRLQLVFFVVAYTRGIVIRRLFNHAR